MPPLLFANRNLGEKRRENAEGWLEASDRGGPRRQAGGPRAEAVGDRCQGSFSKVLGPVSGASPSWLRTLGSRNGDGAVR